MNLTNTWRQVRDFDSERSGLPGEHWAAFGTGLAVLSWAAGRRSSALRMLGMAGGVLLLVRALSGRDGPLDRFSRR